MRDLGWKPIKTNVDVDPVKVAIDGAVNGFTAVCFADGRIRPKRHGEFTSVDPFAVPCTLEKVFVVLEGTTASDAMEFFSAPVRFLIRWIRCIAWTDVRERCVRMMHMGVDVVP